MSPELKATYVDPTVCQRAQMVAGIFTAIEANTLANRQENLVAVRRPSGKPFFERVVATRTQAQNQRETSLDVTRKNVPCQLFETGAHNQRVQSRRRPAASCENGLNGGQFGSAKLLHRDNPTVKS
jgi:hypothetical protein